MNKSEIKKNTILISKFMDFDYVKVGYFNDDDETEWQRKNEEWMDKNAMYDVGDYFVNIKKNKWHEFEKTKYKSSWNWLMPVVKKIINLPDAEKESEGWYAKGSIETFICIVDIDKVYENVIKYIEWYNSKNKN
jgi:hypothetical protein